ncbi:MAG: hypothetical protein ACXVHI_00625 [Frankiaceae bacterium]
MAIETPKALGSLKLSTFYVAPWSRGVAVGRSLAAFLQDRWAREDCTDIYVTCDAVVEGPLTAVLSPFGFIKFAAIPDRYRQGATEVVLRSLR